MKTKTTIRIVTDTDGIQFGYWNTEKEEWIEPKNTDEVARAAEKLNCSPALVEALVMSMEALVAATSGDLRDIWKRLDAIEALL